MYERNYYGKAITCGTVEFFIWECQSYYKYLVLKNVIKIVQEVTCELNHVSSEFIKFPLTTLQHATAIKVFAEEAGCKIPQTVGAINEIRIGILLQASESKAD